MKTTETSIVDAGSPAVIFDLDGTLVDSERNYLEADRIFLARYSVAWTDEQWRQFVGIGSRSMLHWMKKETGTDISIDSLLEEKNQAYLQIARRNTRVFPEMVELVRSLKTAGFALAIATGSSPEVLREVLELTRIGDLFDVVVSAEEVAAGKPAPDVFLEAARRLGVAAELCTVVE
ncbi:MAG TPA: HAD family phosphatase, partial [Spirochaetia bacterium]|nr:HAD family phosphatase [Spirochaetia bacterium]